MSAAQPTQAPCDATPDVSIRAKPPSPKRLSRKVLLSASLGIGGIIAFALVSGLSARPDRRGAEAEAVAAAGGPPESVRLASADYQSSDLPHARDGSGDMLWGDHPPDEAGELAPPQNEVWAGSARGAPSQSSGRGAGAPDPQALARVSPILFGEGRAQAGGASGESRLDAALTPPRSGYELLAGAVIPAALSTELNSDLPGRVIAQVTQPVYDSVSGAHLLIPQGARLIGTYDSATTYGDRRLLLVWNRLILPNGWSINLQGMEGAGPTGAAGLSDRTDNHLAGLAGAIGLSAIISVIANEAEDDEPSSLVQSVGDAAAQEAARTGGRIVDRELNVRPTLRVRAGAPVRVLITRDIRLRAYRN